MSRKSRGPKGTAAPRSSSKRPLRQEPQSPVVSKRPRRQASAASLKARSTPTKSQYFEGSSSSDADSSEASADNDDLSAFEGSVDEVETASTDDDDDAGTSEDEATPRSRARPQLSKQVNRNAKAGGHPGKGGAESGLGPGTQVIIKKPKARPAGSTPYQDETIHQNTLLFLKDLKANNNRAWLKSHDPDYRQSEQDWKSYVEALTEKIAEADETIPELPYKDVVFRIYRDVRFSKDPTPYKAHFSAAWSRTGRKGPYAAYYVQVQPNGQSLVAGGLWMPEASALTKLRRDIDRRPQRLKAVLMEDDLRRNFLKGAPRQETKVVDAFCKQNASSALKTKPKGYDADHRDIDLLRLKSFTLSRRLSDDEITHPDSLRTVSGLISHLEPLITYLNSVVMPDDGDGDDGGDDDDDDDGGDDRSDASEG